MRVTRIQKVSRDCQVSSRFRSTRGASRVPPENGEACSALSSFDSSAQKRGCMPCGTIHHESAPTSEAGYSLSGHRAGTSQGRRTHRYAASGAYPESRTSAASTGSNDHTLIEKYRIIQNQVKNTNKAKAYNAMNQISD